MSYEVFISFKRNAPDGSGKTRDYEMAADLHRTLTDAGVKVFFSEKDLSTSAFIREIYRALDEATIQIVVGTKPEYVTSEWVHAEWETFLSAIFGKRKRNGEIYTYLEGMTVDQLPLELYNRQSFDSSQKSALVSRILNHLGRPVPQPKPKPVPEPKPKPVEQKPVAKQQPQPVSQPQPAQKPASYKILRVGDKIPFGRYPQGANGEIEPLMWRVLAVEGGRTLLITDDLIDAVPYNEENKKVTWETCTLRKWMNNDFLRAAFSSEEQARIATITNRNPNNPSLFSANGGNLTQDRVFALSIEEAEKFFRSDNDRMAAPTAYAIKQGAYESSKLSLKHGRKTGYWWLRSPGSLSSSAASVGSDGYVYQDGINVSRNFGAVRPAFWLNL
ncbi:MAG: toll/interleukin-1 receptor domain-containing protein [Clostridia bacterium]|nr:toll/interleukin-1 receptor domain-containing protein [Clostridia bacterium]